MKKNLVFLIFAIIVLIAAVVFFIVSENIEIKTKQPQKVIGINNNIEDEDFVGLNSTNTFSQTVNTNNSNEPDYEKAAETGNLNPVAEYQNFKVYDLKTNQEVSLDDFSGKPVFILFWDVSNNDSIATLELLNNKYAEYKDKVTFLSVASAEQKTVVENYISTKNIEIPIYIEENQIATKSYNITTYPSLVIKDKNNVIINVKEGKQEEDAILANLDILSENY